MIGDCNDEPPEFTDSLYIFSVTENSAAGVIPGPTIDSTDADSTSDNQNVVYRAINLGTDSWFDINPQVSVAIGHTHTIELHSYLLCCIVKLQYSNTAHVAGNYMYVNCRVECTFVME